MPCSCSEHRAKLEGHSVKANLLASEIRTEVYDGKSTMVVPVVMARGDIVMNGGLFPVQEMLAEAWNGVPVTVHHPVEEGSFISANASPDALAEWHIGRIFNARVDGVKLVGEAWIDVAKANALAPGLIKTIRSSRPLDVSVGFYSRDEEQEGEMGGRAYQHVNRDIIPNHLALLPNEQGACSWKDGCGVRSNLKRNRKMSGTSVATEKLATIAETVRTALGLKAKIELPKDEDARRSMMAALGKVFKANERSSDDDRRQIIADLVSSDDSPFLADDFEALSMLSPDTLTRMKEEYLADLNAEEEEDPPAEKKPEDEKPKEEDVAARSELPKTAEDLQAMITAAVKASQPDVKAIVTAAIKGLKAEDLMSPEHKAALVVASKVADEQRQALVARIVSLSTMEQAEVEKLPNATLELIANGLHPTPSYAGRVISVAEGADQDPEIRAMTAGADMLQEMKAKGKPNGKAAA